MSAMLRDMNLVANVFRSECSKDNPWTKVVKCVLKAGTCLVGIVCSSFREGGRILEDCKKKKMLRFINC